MSEVYLIEEEQQEFVIDDDQKADWALRKIAEARKETEQWVTFYEDQIKLIKAKGLFREEGLKRKLSDYFGQVPHRITATQASYALPSGKIMIKTQAPKIDTDDEKLIPWLKANGRGEFVQVTEKSKWGELKKTLTITGTQALTEDGEVVPGVTVQEREPVFDVQIKG